MMNTEPVRVTQIIRGSSVDGPGLRTVIFFKGCPLRCEWCHNPETQRCFPEVMYDSRKCIHCNHCMFVCPNKAITYDTQLTISRNSCDACFQCCSACPTGALKPVGRETTVDDLFKDISRDLAWYHTSGGGVTLSGGEPLLFPEFVHSLLKKCETAGIHTCIDTSAAIPVSEWSAVVPSCDLFLIDVKHANNESVAAQTVFKNITYLCNTAARLWIRIPVIPGWNAEEADMMNIADALYPFRNQINLIQLLPFHSMAGEKYRQLDREWNYGIKKPVDNNRLILFRKIFAERSLTVL